jgi:hypothetical protein
VLRSGGRYARCPDLTMVGSGAGPDPRIVEEFRAMTETDMEDRLENLDLRLANIEQILPTLATKDDLKAFGTKDDARAFAMKCDLDQLESRQRALTESVIDRVNHVFDGVLSRRRLFSFRICFTDELRRPLRSIQSRSSGGSL